MHSFLLGRPSASLRVADCIFRNVKILVGFYFFFFLWEAKCNIVSFIQDIRDVLHSG